MTVSSGSRASESAATGIQPLLRAVNEQIEHLHDGGPPDREPADWVCECADDTCFQRIELTRAEFDAVRREPHQWAVKVGHTNGQAVVETRDRYLVVRSNA